MAFMMPVVKNDYNIYKSSRSRRSSECSAPGSACRSRKVSECSRSEGPSSMSTSPGSVNGGGGDFIVGRNHHHGGGVGGGGVGSGVGSPAHRSASRLQSPCKSSSPSPPKNPGSTSSLNKFHTRLVDRLKKSLKSKDSGDARRAS